MITTADIISARSNFPCGLFQPPDSYRFGLDALLLGSWGAHALTERLSHRGTNERACLALELGCGCGAALFVLALTHCNIHCVGLDLKKELLEAAEKNAGLLGLAGRMKFFLNDNAGRTLQGLPGYGHFQLVIANPPWFERGCGRRPKSSLRQDAMFAAPGMLLDFCKIAAGALVHRGYYCCILPPQSLVVFCLALAKTSLGLRRVLPVLSFAGQSARNLLLLCQKNAKSCPEISPPLIMHEKNAGEVRWTEAALQFCPWLDKRE